MFIKVKEKWIYVVDESTNGIEHIYYDSDGNGYYDYEVEETRNNNEHINSLAKEFSKKCVVKCLDDNDYTWDVISNQGTTSNSSSTTSHTYELKGYDDWLKSVEHAQMEMKEVKISTSGGLFAQMNSFAPASVKVVSESDLKQMYEPVYKSEPKTRRSKKKKANTQSTNEADTSN